MSYVLKKSQIRTILESRIIKKNIKDSDIISILEDSQGWDLEITVLNYFISMVLENFRADKKKQFNLIKELYSLPNEYWLTIHEFDRPFINFLYRKEREQLDNLEELLRKEVELFSRTEEWKRSL
ncbi:MAG: hypothetical protein OEZ13_08560 [Spirochaetia bacterium]|nr:hypothetical protein [Spirochaetia bacterium]